MLLVVHAKHNRAEVLNSDPVLGHVVEDPI